MVRPARAVVLALAVVVLCGPIVAWGDDVGTAQPEAADPGATASSTVDPTEPPAGPSSEDALRDSGAAFLAWLETNGMDISHVSLVLSAAGPVATARGTVPENTRLAVPNSVVLNAAASAKRSPEFAAALEATAGRGLRFPAEVGTAVALMYEAFHHDSSFWAPYTSLIPLRLPHPFFYSPQELALASVVPAVAHRINALRNVLLGNFEVLYDTMLKHHPELFGEPDDEAFAAWRSQFAWATAVVSVRGIVTSSEDGTKRCDIVPLVDSMQFESREEPTLLHESTDDGTNYAVVTPRELNAGDFFTYASPIHTSKCNLDLLLNRGHVVNSTAWDCAYLWYNLPERNLTKPYAVPNLVWSVLKDVGLVTEDVLASNNTMARVEAVYSPLEGLNNDILLLARMSALDEDSFGYVARVVAGNAATSTAEQRALSQLVATLESDINGVRGRVKQLVADGTLADDESTWPAAQRLIGVAISGMLRSTELAIHQAQLKWVELLSTRP